MRANDLTRWLRRRGGYATTHEIAAAFGLRRETAEVLLLALRGERKVRKSGKLGTSGLWAAIDRDDFVKIRRKR
jgi:DNA-binding IclR family transcriptional regulator